MSPRDSAALRALLALRGPDGWTRPRARGQLLDVSGLSWPAWRRAVQSLACAGLVESVSGTRGTHPVPTSYRVTEAGETLCRQTTTGTGAAQGGGTGPAQLPESSYSLPLQDSKSKEEEHPEQCRPAQGGTGWAAQGGAGTGGDATAAALLELAAAVRALAEALTSRTTTAPVARDPERAVPPPQKPAATTKPKAERPPLFQRDRRGWTGHDCERPCGSHGTMRAFYNAADDSWFGRCAACGRRYDPAVERRNATPPDRPAQPAARPPSSPGSVGASVGALLQSLSGGLGRSRTA